MIVHDLTATEMLLWGWVIHLIADLGLQNAWMAANKARRRQRNDVGAMQGAPFRPYDGPWWDRHPAAYVHAGIHGVLLLLVLPWWAALLVAVLHLLIDTRAPLAWWSRLIRQDQPGRPVFVRWRGVGTEDGSGGEPFIGATQGALLVDMGMLVRFWLDQAAHVVVLAVVALLVAA